MRLSGGLFADWLRTQGRGCAPPLALARGDDAAPQPVEDAVWDGSPEPDCSRLWRATRTVWMGVGDLQAVRSAEYAGQVITARGSVTGPRLSPRHRGGLPGLPA